VGPPEVLSRRPHIPASGAEYRRRPGGEQGRQAPLCWTGDGTVPDCFTEAESDDTKSEAIDMPDLLSGATRLFPIIGDPIRYVESPMRLTRTFGAPWLQRHVRSDAGAAR
jgi:hypothetical protein